MKNILFLSYWGWGRGQAYLTLCHVKMLQDSKHKVFILKQGTNRIAEEFKSVDVTIIEYPEYNVNPEFFKKTLLDNKIDIAFFNEYNQWGNDGNNLVKVAKECGAKAYGWLVWEKWANKEAYKDYDRLIASTVSFERFYRKQKVRNFTYVPYSIDLNEFTKLRALPARLDDDRFIFFHPGGWGGVHNRKNTDVVIEAFDQLNDDNTKLVITSQKPLQFNRELNPNIEIIDKNLSRQELIDLYYHSNCVVLPSKWESIGLPILESLASGTPVITTNVAPMNEFVREGLNGYLVNPTMSKYPDISVYSADVDVVDLKNKMKSIQNKMLHTVLCRNARHVVEEIYDLEKNKHYLRDLIDRDLK